MTAVTQARGVGSGRAYLAKEATRGKDKTATMRRRRQLSDVVFSTLHADQRAAARIEPQVTALAA